MIFGTSPLLGNAVDRSSMVTNNIKRTVESNYMATHTPIRHLNNTETFFNCIFTIYSRYLKKVISKRDGCAYVKQVPSIDGSLELI
jgi:hypothetical protein